jgi:hypothetical protein
MAVEHMVWIRFKDGVTAERIDNHLRGLRALPDKIAGIVNLCVGENFTDRAAGHTHGLLVTFDNRAALEHYLPHAEHLAVAGPLKEDAASLMAMDFEH